MIGNVASGILISAFVISFPFAVVVSPATQLNAGAGFDGGVAAGRIDDAFASLANINVDPESADIATPFPKGDFPPRLSECASAVWPNVDASCLSTADGSPVPPVRSITIGYQNGVNTTVLLRIPAAVVARR